MTPAERRAAIESNMQTAEYWTTVVCRTAKRDDPRWQDTFGAACVALCEAVDAWRPGRGATLRTFASRVVENRVRLVSMQDCRHRVTHVSPATPTGVSATVDGDFDLYGDVVFEALQARTGTASPSPEDELLAAEARAVGAARLAKLVGNDREYAEAALAGRPHGVGRGRPPVAKVAKAAGVRLAATTVPAARAMTQSERNRRYLARLSPEKRQEKLALKRAAYARRRAAAQMAVAA